MVRKIILLDLKVHIFFTMNAKKRTLTEFVINSPF